MKPYLNILTVRELKEGKLAWIAVEFVMPIYLMIVRRTVQESGEAQLSLMSVVCVMAMTPHANSVSGLQIETPSLLLGVS